MTSSFLTTDGFIVSWRKNKQDCWVKVQDEKKARELFARLKSKLSVELFEIKNQQFKKIA